MKCVITRGERNLVTDTIKLLLTAGAHGHEDLIIVTQTDVSL